ncbi:MAG: AMP-dependent synthetase and ligase [Spirochaetes bacterium]|nr:MAG: AMP-dependent synthetase and ligase [Spirochaetota bacterium]
MKKTVFRMLDEASANWAHDPYALRKTDQGYAATTFAQAREKARGFGAWVVSRGYSKGERFAVLGEGSPEWICGEFGLMCAGIISVPLSIKLLSEEIPFRLDHSESRGILTTHNQLEKVLSSFSQASSQERIVVYLDEDLDWARITAEKHGIAADRIFRFSDCVREGAALLADTSSSAEAKLNQIAQSVEEDDVVTISYTSGTTGNPKGIMLTHLNYWSNCHDAVALFDDPIHFRTLLVLPVDHSFAHTVGLYTALVCGIALYFVDSRGGGIATLRNIPINLKEANPTFLFTVPSLSGNFMKKIIAGIEEKGGALEKIFKAGIAAGIRWNGDGWQKTSFITKVGAFFPYFLAKAIMFKKIVRMVFGDSIKFCVGGGALLDVKQQEFFAALGVPVFQGYGLTEAAPIISSNTPKKHKFGSSGVIAPSVTCKIMRPDGTEAPPGVSGEIAVHGENVMKGYFKNPAATAEALHDDLLWTGDLGYMDRDGFLYVVGRAKAVLIADDGEKYSPEEIEEAIITSTDLIDQIMVWCDHKKYSCALVSLDTAKLQRFTATKGLSTPQSILDALIKEFYAFKTDPKAKKVQGAWIPGTFQIIGAPFNEKDGTVNSTMKIVRYKVAEVYRELLEYSYSSEGSKTNNPRNLETLAKLTKKG